MKKIFLFCACLLGLGSTGQAQIVLQKAVISNGGNIATNGITVGAVIVGQTVTGSASNSQTIGHFGFFSEAGAIPSSISKEGRGSISSLRLSPNPAAGDVNINMTLLTTGNIDLLLYDASGHLISTLFSGKKEAGTVTQHFDVKMLPSGTYFVAARTSGALMQAKLDVVK